MAKLSLLIPSVADEVKSFIDEMIDGKIIDKVDGLFWVPLNYAWGHYLFDKINNNDSSMSDYYLSEEKDYFTAENKASLYVWFANALVDYSEEN